MRLALPSDGELHESSLGFLQSCGIDVDRAGSRRYTASLPTVPGAVALFQRAADITSKVEEGSADLGIVGLDRYMETRREAGDALVVVDDLGFGRCELVVAVPEAWADVTSTADLADLAVEFRAAGRELRIATKFPLMVERFLYTRGINYFALVLASGTLEAAPIMGYADLIADLTASGTTLRENGLKTLTDGTVLVAQACLIANRRVLAREPVKLEQARTLIERVEARLRAMGLCSVTGRLTGVSREVVAARMAQASAESTTSVSDAPAPDGSGVYAVTLVVRADAMLEEVEWLRDLGGTEIAVSPVSYLFGSECEAYTRLLAAMGGERNG